jgi:CubicO group peptidase (beta-lactamase class C family)
MGSSRGVRLLSGRLIIGPQAGICPGCLLRHWRLTILSKVAGVVSGAREAARRMGSEQDFGQLGEFVRQEMDRLHVPGVAVGVRYDGHDYTAGFGVTNVLHPLPVTDQTLFQIGSTSKTVCGTAAMRLVEQQRLDLDVPVRTYLPDLQLADPTVAAAVTLRHLFNHTGGWQGDFFADTGAGDDALQKMSILMSSLPQITPLGTVFSYNNAGLYLAGRVIEVVTGKTYEAAARELVLDPLEMKRSFFFAREVIADRVAIGHRVGSNGPEVLGDWELRRVANPGGGIVSTVGDQLRYARFHMGDGTAADGTHLLSKAALGHMQTPSISAGNGIAAVGVAWMLRDVGGVRLVQHGGVTNGLIAAFQMAPACGFAITVLTNADTGAELNRQVVAWALKRYLGVEDTAPLVRPASLADLGEFVGRYTAHLTDLQLSVQAGKLAGQLIPKGGFPTTDSPPPPMKPPFPMGLTDNDQLVILDGPLKNTVVDVLRGDDGRISFLRAGYRLHKRQVET